MREEIKGIEIPVNLRSLVYQGFRFAPLNRLGKTYYKYAAKHTAKQLQETIADAKIIYFGGSVDRCVPGISDLDFLIIRKEEFSADVIWDLRAAYFELKRKFPVLGEVHATLKSSWDAFEFSPIAARLWFKDRKRYDEGMWKRSHSKSRAPFSKFSRFALCLHHFERAQRHLIKATQTGNAFHRANFVREISKVSCWSEGNEITLQSGFNPGPQLGMAFYQLHQLAKKALKEEAQETLKSDLKLELELPTTQGVQFIAEMVNRRWKERFTQAGISGMRATPVPSLFLPSQSISLGSSLGIYHQLVEFFKTNAEAEMLPQIYSKEILECASLGWNWGSDFPHLQWQTSEQLKDEMWCKRCAIHTYQRLSEHFFLEMNLIRGKFIYSNPETVQQVLTVLARNLLTLGTGLLTGNLVKLRERASKKFPLTTRALLETSDSKRLLGLDRLWDHCLAIGCEAALIQGA